MNVLPDLGKQHDRARVLAHRHSLGGGDAHVLEQLLQHLLPKRRNFALGSHLKRRAYIVGCYIVRVETQLFDRVAHERNLDLTHSRGPVRAPTWSSDSAAGPESALAWRAAFRAVP